MNLFEVNYKKELLNHHEMCTAETSANHSLSPGSPSTDGIIGDPPVLPRLGDQYQVEIPSLMAESERLQLQHRPINNDDMLGVNCYMGIGLAIPIMWVHHVGHHIKHELQELTGTTVGGDTVGSLGNIDNKESWLDPKHSTESGSPTDSLNSYGALPQGSTCKVKTLDDQLEHGKEFARSTSLECRTSNDQRNTGLPWLQWRKTKGYIPLPGLPVAPWSDAESQSFLLGLYIFGKNLFQVKKFVESKEMGAVLSFYYGKFYKSDAHHRWMECRKIRSRRCIFGHRIFTGWRQQELLSRLLPGKSKEVQNTLLKATKTFNEGRASLEEFVFTLKATAGMEAIVEGIGIGKGKQDLTGIILDPVRTNSVIPTRPEIPIGKACSSLTPGDIISFLTGDFRLSKARSNDLFWEAVWPRLLARGWHSEQPKDLSAIGSKHALVFIIPGIKKFSRKKLVKGNHYFDSVSDVLNKVASDPRLLELEVEGAERSGSLNDEFQWDAETKLSNNGFSIHQRPCYLQPRIPNCNSEFMKFTVVDTSLVQGEAPSMVRELRSLPVDATRSYGPSNHSGETNSNSSLEQSSSTDISLNEQGESDPNLSNDKKVGNRKRGQSGLSDHLLADPKRRLPLSGHDLEGQCWDLLNGKQPVKDTKCQFSHRLKSGQPNYLAPVSKQQRLPYCKYAATGRRSYSLPRGRQLKKGEEHCKLKSLEASKAIGAEVAASQEMISEAVLSQVKPQPRTLIDLNLPHFPPDFDTQERFTMEVEGIKDDLDPKEPSLQSKPKQQLDDSQAFEANNGVFGEQQPMMNGRRQSTRNRPPTTRALEALACGFLSTSRRGRGMKIPRSRNLTSRSSRQARKTIEVPIPAPNTNLVTVSPNIMVPSVGMDEEYSIATNHASLFSDNSHVQSERKGTHELLGVL